MNLSPLIRLVGAAGMAAAAALLPAAEFKPNYDEAKVPSYTLPDPLIMADGRPVTNRQTWIEQRRPEILRLFEEHVYGRSPGQPPKVRGKVVESGLAFEGLARRQQVTLSFARRKGGPQIHLLLYLPAQARGPVPVFASLNFNGNHALSADPAVLLPAGWMRDKPGAGVVNNRATEAGRGSEPARWPLRTILARGYGVATACYGDLEPDFPEGWKQGVRAVFIPEPVSRTGAGASSLGSKKTRSQPTAAQQGGGDAAGGDAWGAVGAWAWGLSRILDYLETVPEVDAGRVVVVGHSRLGKTALWAGAQDQRFAAVISNNSGCNGAALSRRQFGETVERINTSFPHWFCANHKRYNRRENELPVDQHMLLALIAPRPVYVASAAEDRWADPKGEFLSLQQAEPVYRLFGIPGVGTDSMPGLDQPVGRTLAYHIRTGKHDITEYDWARYLDFADRELAASPQRSRPR